MTQPPHGSLPRILFLLLFTAICISVVTAGTTGTLEVSSKPSGATITVDGAVRGVTPATITGLAPGSHAAVLSLFDCLDYSKTVKIKADKVTKIKNAKLKPARGTISITSTVPGIEVQIDGVTVGITPVVVTDVPAGSHLVRVWSYEYLPFEKNVRVKGGKTTKVKAKMSPINAYVDPPAPPAERRIYWMWTLLTLTPGVTDDNVMTLGWPATITSIKTLHWTGGSAGGSLGLRRADGSLVGTWPVVRQNAGSQLNALWVATMSQKLPPGRYTIVDSEPSTWSKNPASTYGKGLAQVFAYYTPANPIDQVEQAIFKYTNEERTKRGLPPYLGDSDLAGVARRHSTDMQARDFFGHVNPDGEPYGNLTYRLTDYRGVYPTTTAWGENIFATSRYTLNAYPDTVGKYIVYKWVYDDASSGWGHRHSILDGIASDTYPGWTNYGFNRMGVAVVYDADTSKAPTGYIATQQFVKRT